MGACANCGSFQEPGVKFCTSCGTRASVGESASNGTAVQAAPELRPAATALAETPQAGEIPSSYPESPFYPESKSGSGGLGRGIAIVAVVVIVGCALGYYFLAPQKPKGPAPIIDGRQNVATTVQTFGLEKYPGARPVAASSSDTEQVAVAFETNDTPQQVIGYYRVRFPVAQVTTDPTHSTLSAEMNGNQVLITADALVRGSRVRISFSKIAANQ
jgi:hypothetical protein